MRIGHLFIALIMLAVFFLITSCEKSVEWDIEAMSEPNLVIESILTDEIARQEVRLQLSASELNQFDIPITDAQITVRTGAVEYIFLHEASTPGCYKSTAAFGAVPLLDYELIVDWNGNRYSAQSQLAEVAPIPTLLFPRFGSTDSLELNQSIVPILSTSQQAMYQFDLDWSHIYAEGANSARAFYYTFTSLHNSQFIRPPAAEVPFPKGTLVVVSKYGLDDDFADFLRATAIETDWNGSYFYGNPENATGNISGEALGYFAICALVRDTLIAE